MSENSLKEYVYGLAKKVPGYYDDFGLNVWYACYRQFLFAPVIWYMKNNQDATADDISRFIMELSNEQEEALRIYEEK